MADFDPNKPYNALPELPPSAEQTDIESKAILKKCILARAALAELKQSAELVPNPAILINTLPILEAKDSSEIENIVTTTDKLFAHVEINRQVDPATKEALRYRTALYEGYQAVLKKPLNTNTAVAICQTIKATEMQIRRVPGTALANDKTGETIYAPPEGESLLREKLANWERFLHNQTQTDPLIRMAIGHYQFAAIHPFTDGNGRTGRILNILFLIQSGLLTLPILYMSRFIIQTKSDYYQKLLAVTTQNAWEDWILYMLDAVQQTANWTATKIAAMRSLMQQTIAQVQRQLRKIYRYELIEILFTQPYCRISNIVDAGIAKRQAASDYLKQLVDIGILKEISLGREKLFINTQLLALFTDNES